MGGHYKHKPYASRTSKLALFPSSASGGGGGGGDVVKQQSPFCLAEKAFRLSGWQDSNLRPPGPKPGAIPGYATPRTFNKLQT